VVDPEEGGGKSTFELAQSISNPKIRARIGGKGDTFVTKGNFPHIKTLILYSISLKFSGKLGTVVTNFRLL